MCITPFDAYYNSRIYFSIWYIGFNLDPNGKKIICKMRVPNVKAEFYKTIYKFQWFQVEFFSVNFCIIPTIPIWYNERVYTIDEFHPINGDMTQFGRFNKMISVILSMHTSNQGLGYEFVIEFVTRTRAFINYKNWTKIFAILAASTRPASITM